MLAPPFFALTEWRWFMSDGSTGLRFDYNKAFERTLGWITEWEQAALRTKCIAIAGMGGVGGAHLLTLTRLGIGQFRIADFDRFDLVNFNRQAGASMVTIGRLKVDVMCEMARSINPDVKIECFPDGVTTDNVNRFLSGCDLYVDGLDFAALDIRALVHARSAALRIPAIGAGPIGMAASFLAFHPGGMTFEEYFRLDGQKEDERFLRFLIGYSPGGRHVAYLADNTRVDIAAKRGPSTAAACELCAGVVATQALKVLLRRGGVDYAPVHLLFDAYLGRVYRTKLRWGLSGPIQRLKLAIARPLYRKMSASATGPSPAALPDFPFDATRLLAILDLARWAPSADNTQPWRFEPLGEEDLLIHMLDAPAHFPAPIDYRDKEAAWLQGGILLESIRIAATVHGCATSWTVGSSDPPWTIRVRIVKQLGLESSPLAAELPMRSVVRTGLGRRSLTTGEKAELAAALGPDLTVTWIERWSERWRVARMAAMASDIRLRMIELYPVHKSILDWNRDRSPDGLPVKAIGLNWPTRKLMHWAMDNWPRMDRLNRYLGTGGATLQLDLGPGLASSAFFVVRFSGMDNEPAQAARLLRAGEHVQRFWLTASRLGLTIQPSMGILAFAVYGKTGGVFTRDQKLVSKARALAAETQATFGNIQEMVFIGRVGRRRDQMPGSRSVRKPLAELLWISSRDPLSAQWRPEGRRD